MTTIRYKMIVEYDGTNYKGWQRQKDVPSIQQDIETAITKFCQQTITIHAAGRTDAGVHARGQVIHFDLAPLKRPITPFEIAKAINAHLRPAPIVITHAEIAPPDFHARFGAKQKLYRYRIINRRPLLALDKGKAWLCHKPMNATKMHEAAQHLIGHHDFSTFRAAECQAQSPMRTLDEITVRAFPYDHYGGQEIHIEAKAQSFLHHQVRNIAGTLQLVGEGKWTPQDVKTALISKNRKNGGPTAPAEGLYMMHIDYL